MNTKELYDAMINLVENGVERCEVTEIIIDGLAKKLYCDKRVLGEIFKFMTGMSAYEYIKERRLMRAYRYLVQDEGKMEFAIDYSGAETHSSFDKKFKERFGHAPGEVRAMRKMDLYDEPLTWEKISDGSFDCEGGKRTLEKQKSFKFGIEESKLNRYIETMTLQALYGLSEEETEEVFQFANEEKLEIAQAFKCYIAAKEGLNENEKENLIKYARMLSQLCQTQSMGFEQADEFVCSLFHEININGYEEEPVCKLITYAKWKSNFLDYLDFCTAYHYFWENGGEDGWWEYYTRNLGCATLKEALEKAKQEAEELDSLLMMDDEG